MSMETSWAYMYLFSHIPGQIGMEKVLSQEADVDTEAKRHELKHKRPTDTNSSDFPCKLCNFRSAKKFRIKEHVKEVHDKIKDFAVSVTTSVRESPISNCT